MHMLYIANTMYTKVQCTYTVPRHVPGTIIALFKIYCTTVFGRDVRQAALHLFTLLPKYAVHFISKQSYGIS